MTDVQLVNIGAWIIATLFGILVMLLRWLGTRLVGMLEKLSAKVDAVSDTLHDRVTDLDRRVTRVEAHTGMDHQIYAQGRPRDWPPHSTGG